MLDCIKKHPAEMEFISTQFNYCKFKLQIGFFSHVASVFHPVNITLLKIHEIKSIFFFSFEMI